MTRRVGPEPKPREACYGARPEPKPEKWLPSKTVLISEMSQQVQVRRTDT